MMTVLESKALGASSSYMDIDVFRPAGQWAEDPMSIGTNSGARYAYCARRAEVQSECRYNIAL